MVKECLSLFSDNTPDGKRLEWVSADDQQSVEKDNGYVEEDFTDGNYPSMDADDGNHDDTDLWSEWEELN